MIARLCLLLLALLPPTLPAAPLSARHVSVELLAEDTGVSSGRPLWVMLHFSPEDGWHTYWKNPGDSGLAPQLAWTLPPGWQAREPLFPTPSAIPYGSQTNYGYEGPNGLLVELVPPPTLAGDQVELNLQARWLVCADACVPGQGEFQLQLPVVTDSRPDPAQATRFARLRASLPVALAGEGTYQVSGGQVELILPAQGLPAGSFTVFVAPGQLAEPGGTPRFSRQNGSLLIQLPLHAYYSTSPARIEVVLSQGPQGWALPARLADSPSPTSATGGLP